MKSKEFKGKAIYNPSGKAGEYSVWACNFYVGCSNGCTYCYLKKGRGAKILGGATPTLKSCFKNEAHAMEIFDRELLKNLDELKKHGLFFSFTTDPMLDETIELTQLAARFCLVYDIPVKILTKRTQWVYPFLKELVNNDTIWNLDWQYKYQIAFGFTLTGHDDLEPNACAHSERIKVMEMLNREGIKTFASIEPIISFQASLNMINQTVDFCDLYKVGLESGKKYDVVEGQTFVERLMELDNPVYLKESLQKLTHYTNADSENFVERDFNLFE